MKRLLILLLLIGSVAYLLNTGFLARTSLVGGSGEQTASSPPQAVSAEMAETSASPDPGPSPSGPRNSPHAISVDQPPSEEVDAVSSSPREARAANKPGNNRGSAAPAGCGAGECDPWSSSIWDFGIR